MTITLGKKTSGVVLMVALFIIVASGITVAAYLSLMSHETRVAARSRTWNNCVPVMEAGVEEALAHIHSCNGTTNFGSNNWTLNSTNYYQKTRYLGTDGSYFVVTIQPTNNPVIYSTAYVPVSDTLTNYISRSVRVTTKSRHSGSGGLAAKSTITFSGNSVIFDSFDSSVGSYDSNNHGTNAMALTDSSAAGAIDMQNGTIYGTAVTGPGGTVTGGGTITGGVSHDANVQIDDSSLPSALLTGLPPAVNQMINSQAYAYYLSSGDYLLPGDLSVQNKEVVGVSGNVRLYVTGNVSISGQASFSIPAGSSLTMYVGGSSINIGGGGFVNQSLTAANVTIYGLTTCTGITFTGGSSFFGVVDAPEAALDFQGSVDYYGSFTANTIKVSGMASIHYDQALGASQPLVVLSWNEI